VHCHTPSLLPFAVCKQADLRPLYHMSGFLGRGAARFEIRDFAGAATDLLVSTPALGKSLAGCLGDKQLILMRGHGATLVGETVRHSVYRAIYAAINATVQAEAMRLGEVTYLSPEEAESGMNINDRFNQRSWELWKLEALGGMK
jgi:ribulose-5-phosphate 4-epimerase/fuculose-1-phosphate aldolase